MTPRLSIGQVARRAGATVPTVRTVRYYEEIGLLQPAIRTASGQRSYDEAALRRLAFIRRCRDFGFSLDQVRGLVGLMDQPDRPCREALDIASLHLEQVRHRLEELRALEQSLLAFVVGCETACAGGPSVDCTLLEDLAKASEVRSAPSADPRPGCCRV